MYNCFAHILCRCWHCLNVSKELDIVGLHLEPLVLQLFLRAGVQKVNHIPLKMFEECSMWLWWSRGSGEGGRRWSRVLWCRLGWRGETDNYHRLLAALAVHLTQTKTWRNDQNLVNVVDLAAYVTVSPTQ